MSVSCDLVYRWNDPGDLADAARFAGSVIGASAAYISHGEVQAGLSDDGKSWVRDLAKLYADEFADKGDRDILVVRDGQHQVTAILIIAYEATKRRKFAIIEDMAVDPALRSHGVGAQMMERAEARIRERGVEWVFLESGIRNKDAHRFFEKSGFAKMSSIFGRQLGP